MRRARGPREDGFTLTEVLVVVTIVGILAATVVVAVGGVVGTSRVSACTANVNAINLAAEAYYAKEGRGAPTLEALVAAGFLRGGAAVSADGMATTDYTITFAEAEPLTSGPGGVGAASCAPSGAPELSAGAQGLPDFPPVPAACQAGESAGSYCLEPSRQAIVSVSPHLVRVGATITATLQTPAGVAGRPSAAWGGGAVTSDGSVSVVAPAGSPPASFSGRSPGDPILVPVSGCGATDRSCTWRVVSGSDQGDIQATWLALRLRFTTPAGPAQAEDYFGVVPDRFRVSGLVRAADGSPLAGAVVRFTGAASTYVSGPGDTVDSLADRFGLVPDQLTATNPDLVGGATVTPGVTVHVPSATVTVTTLGAPGSAGAFAALLTTGMWYAQVVSPAPDGTAAEVVVGERDQAGLVLPPTNGGVGDASTTTTVGEGTTGTTSTTLAAPTGDTTSTTVGGATTSTTAATAPGGTPSTTVGQGTTSTTVDGATTTTADPVTTETTSTTEAGANGGTTSTSLGGATGDTTSTTVAGVTGGTTSTTVAGGTDDTTSTTDGSATVGADATSTTATQPSSLTLAPIVTCSWALPDMSGGAGTFSYADANGYSSDDPLQQPSPVPCTLDASGAGQLPGAHHTIGVRPNTADSPGARRVELWGEVGAAAGGRPVDHVAWEIFPAGGSTPVTVDGERRPTAACVGPPGLFQAAQRTGQLGQTVVDDPSSGLVAQCESGRQDLYEATTTISSRQPCGEYRIELHARAGRAETVLVSFMDVDCVIQVDTNLSEVTWPTVAPNSTVTGLTAGGATPSVEQSGNTPLAVTVVFAPLVRTDPSPPTNQGGFALTSFGAGLGVDRSHLELVDPVAAGTPARFGDPADLLLPGQADVLELYLHAGPAPPPGHYAGSLTLFVAAVPPAPVGDSQTPPGRSSDGPVTAPITTSSTSSTTSQVPDASTSTMSTAPP